VSKHDVIFLGTSPNALVAAARLAGAGRSVLLLDTRAAPGGPVATEMFAPGFHADSGVMSVALDPEVASALDLSLDVLRRDVVTSLGATPLSLRTEPVLPAAITHAVTLLRAIYASEPPALPVPTAAGAASLDGLSALLSGFGAREMHEVLRLLFLSARDFFREVGLPEVEQGLLAGAAVRGLSEGPFAAGTLFSFLHHLAIGEGLFQSSARGGLGKLAQALADKALASGAEVRTGVPGPLRVDVQDGVARGVVLPDGTRLESEVVVSDHDARFTFTRLVPPSQLDPEFNRILANLRYRGSAARVHLGLAARPVFNGLDEDAYGGTLVLAPDVRSIERAWDQAKRGRVSDPPYIEATLPTVADPGLAPEGKHVLSAWVQYVPYGAGEREALFESVLGHLASFAPGLPGLVLHHEVLLPEDLEARFDLTEGHLYGGQTTLQQAFFLRPFSGSSGYETPIENLYLGGSAAHPAGYSGRSGWNLAGSLLARRF
jgi:phytoene dehydrogenase-like protein